MLNYHNNKFVDIIVGARPNFIKIYKLVKIFKKKNKNFRLVHTGQHYNLNMSDVFFKQLKIKKPDVNLKVKEKTHAHQIGKIMMKYESLININKPNLVIVVGDVNSTLACSLVASRNNIKIAHIEAGLRSNDKSMPEEINRILTDQMSDFLFVTSKKARQNLLEEGIQSKKIFLVGNTMIDTLFEFKSLITKNKKNKKLSFINKDEKFIVVTIHRPENTDNQKNLKNILNILLDLSKKYTVIFPTHPRIRKKLDKNKFKNIKFIDPMGYLNFLNLVQKSKLVLTDSGGITEEASVMNIPCITIRKNTERPETITHGTNLLSKAEKSQIWKNIWKIENKKWKQFRGIPLWDGKTSNRIFNIIKKY